MAKLALVVLALAVAIVDAREVLEEGRFWNDACIPPEDAEEDLLLQCELIRRCTSHLVMGCGASANSGGSSGSSSSSATAPEPKTGPEVAGVVPQPAEEAAKNS